MQIDNEWLDSLYDALDDLSDKCFELGRMAAVEDSSPEEDKKYYALYLDAVGVRDDIIKQVRTLLADAR